VEVLEELFIFYLYELLFLNVFFFFFWKPVLANLIFVTLN